MLDFQQGLLSRQSIYWVLGSPQIHFHWAVKCQNVEKEVEIWVHSKASGYALNGLCFHPSTPSPSPISGSLVFEESITLPFLLGSDLGVLGEVQFCVWNAAWGRATKKGYSYRAKLSLPELQD